MTPQSPLPTALDQLLSAVIGPERTQTLRQQIWVDPELLSGLSDQGIHAPVIAQALNMMLFEDLIGRVPDAAAYTAEKVASGSPVLLDHGALRTVAWSGLPFPSGHLAFARILEPLGYRMVGKYPLDRLGMCGFVYCHQAFPASLSQFFVSELYPERFSTSFQETVAQVLTRSRDLLTEGAVHRLSELGERGALNLGEAARLLPDLLRCFGRAHDAPTFAEYQALKSESREMAWIATEGNVFNHATDRVEDLDAVVENQKRLGRSMKPEIEEGQNANIRQTAYRAHTVDRVFRDEPPDHPRPVPGSFFEFIQRGYLQTSDNSIRELDLRFDSQNAQGIFQMTRPG